MPALWFALGLLAGVGVFVGVGLPLALRRQRRQVARIRAAEELLERVTARAAEEAAAEDESDQP